MKTRSKVRLIVTVLENTVARHLALVLKERLFLTVTTNVAVYMKANTNTGCLFGKDPPSEDGTVGGISDKLVTAMRTNLDSLPGFKWQYYGNKDGVMYSYPAKSSCHRSTYDPRLRFTAILCIALFRYNCFCTV